MARFYWDGVQGQDIGVEWRDGALDPVPFRVAVASCSRPVLEDGAAAATKAKQGAPPQTTHVEGNPSDVFEGFARLGAGMVVRVDGAVSSS